MKNNVYPSKPQFNYIKVGFKGVKLYRHVFVMVGLFFIVPYLFFFQFLRRAVLRDCGLSWVSSVIIFRSPIEPSTLFHHSEVIIFTVMFY